MPPTSSPCLSAIWEDLTEGRTRITRTFSTPERMGLELTSRNICVEKFRLLPRECRLVEVALLSRSQKAAAIDLEVSSGRVAAALRRCFLKMGVDCTYRTVPPMLVLAVLAGRTPVQTRGLLIQTTTHDAGTTHLVSMERVDARARTLFSPSESAVARMMIEGNTYEQMAVARRTSRRTIANQVGAVLAKAGAAGRVDLISRLSLQV